MLAGHDADAARVGLVVEHSLDRKVCNTLNVAIVPESRAAELVPIIVDAADRAAAARGGEARLHLSDTARVYLPASDLDRVINVERAGGVVREQRATVIDERELGTEWEWENTPELTIAVADNLEQAIGLFNAHSPRFVASVITESPDARNHAYALLDAPFVGDGFTRWADGQYALKQPELGLSNWENGRLLARAGILTGADLTTLRTIATTPDPTQHR
jgi:glutamate-5-semialdehyde dehydrogenase